MRMLVGFLVSAFIFTAIACGSSSYGPSSNPPASCTGSGASVTIDATGSFTFSPASPPAIVAGQKVCWVNNSGFAHTVSSGTAQTMPSDDRMFTGGALPNGSTVVVTFATAGSYPFHCNVHLPPTYNMTGTISVNP